MPTSYPGSNDSFKVPDSPTTVVLNSPGDATRNHGQFHQDTGDAIIALQQNATLLSHDHSGTGSRPTEQLNQSNTHQNSDTDSGPTALHHTIGATPNQAAAGNHLHTGVYLPNYTPYYARVNFGPAGGFYTNNANDDTLAGPGWVATDDTSSLWTAGTNPQFTIPAAGKWHVYFRAVGSGTSSTGAYIGCKVLKNLPTGTAFNNSYVIAGDSRSVGFFANVPMVSEMIRFAKNDTVRFSIFTSISLNINSNINYVGDSYMSITYIGP